MLVAVILVADRPEGHQQLLRLADVAGIDETGAVDPHTAVIGSWFIVCSLFAWACHVRGAYFFMRIIRECDPFELAGLNRQSSKPFLS